MNIGIFTFFESNNYGTVLQAYALQDYLEKFNHCVTIIHIKRNVNGTSSYYVEKPREYTLMQRVKNRVVMYHTAKLVVRKKEEFKRFRENRLHTTSVCYENGKEFLRDVAQYDLIISGGDQIWNPYHKVFSLDYMLDFLPANCRRIAYGSSFGVEKISDEELLLSMKNALGKYESIGVREKSGVDIVRHMGIIAQQVVDPVFLNIDCWKEFVTKKPPLKQKYGIVYALVDYKDECDLEIKQYEKRNKLKMVVLPENRRNCTNNYKKEFGLSPEEFVNYIAHSEVVFTNSFHGLAFALIFHKQVVLLEPITEEAKSKQNRLFDLLAELNIKNTLESIDYDKVEKMLREQIQSSRQYLENAIKNNASSNMKELHEENGEVGR